MINDHSPRMATELPTRTTNGERTPLNAVGEENFTVKTGLARMLKGGVIMDVVNAEQVCQFSLTPLCDKVSSMQCSADGSRDATK